MSFAMNKGIVYLSMAIVCEVLGTTSMKLSEGFTHLGSSLCVILFYSTAFTMLTLALRTLDLSVAYALWSGIGTALIALIGAFYFNETFSLIKISGIGFIILGTVLLRL